MEKVMKALRSVSNLFARSSLASFVSDAFRSKHPHTAHAHGRKPPKRLDFSMEAMEPRLLLSATVIDLNDANNTFVFDQTGANAWNITIDGTETSYTGAVGDSIVINGLGGNDVFTLNFDDGLGGFGLDISLDGGAGNDSLMFNGLLDLNGMSFSAAAELITISAGAAISDANNVTLLAVASDTANVTSEVDVLDRVASVEILGDILASGNVTLSATASSNIALDGGSIVSVLEADATRSASVVVDGATINAAALTISALTSGTVSTVATGSLIDSWIARNTFFEEAIVQLTGADVVAGGISLSAETGTQYLARGRFAENTVTGTTRASIENSTLTATTGGVLISAKDTSRLEADSPATDYQIPDGLPIDISASIARNALTRDVQAFVANSTLTANGGDILITATKDVTTIATAMATSVSNSLGLTTYGAVSFGGTFASNVVQGDIVAYADQSALTASAGSVELQASDTSALNASAQTSAQSGSGDLSLGGGVTAIGASIAFNSLGWQTTEAALSSVDALIGDPTLAAAAFGGNVGADVKAYLRNTTVDASDTLLVAAFANAAVGAVVSNRTSGTASSPVFGASSSALGGVVSSNKISGVTEASVDFTADYDGLRTLSADGGISVTALDARAINAVIELTAISETVNPTPLNGADSLGIAGAVALNDVRGGATASVAGATLAASAGAVLVSAQAEANILAHLESAASSAGGNAFGQGTSLAAAGLIATNAVQDGAQASISNSTVGTLAVPIGGDVTVEARNTASINATLVNATSSGNQAIGVTLAFNSIGWANQNVLFNTLDAITGATELADEFGGDLGADAKAWIADSTLRATGALAVSATTGMTITSDISNVSQSEASAWLGAKGLGFGAVVAGNKISSEAQAWISDATVTADQGTSVTASDAALIDALIVLEAKSTTSNTAPWSDSNAYGLGGALSLNDVRGGASAYLDTVVLHGGAVLVQALEDATLTADLQSAASSTGGKTHAVAAGLLMATNAVQNDAQAYIAGSTIGTAALPVTGAVTVNAQNTAAITADVLNATSSGNDAVALTLAFNAIGWAKQNILFNTVDTIIGASNVADAFGGELGADARAWIIDSEVDAAGLLTVSATAGMDIGSTISNVAASEADRLFGAEGLGFGAVVSSNKVSSQAQASIDYSATYAGAQVMNAVGGTTVGATDGGTIDANITLQAKSIISNTAPWSDSNAYGLGGAVALNEVSGGATAFINEATLSGGAVQVLAVEDASLTAHLESAVASSGGSKFGSGASLAVSGLIATNTVKNDAQAYITDSTVGTSSSRLAGAVTVDAQNTAAIDATVVNATSSGNQAIGVTLAFNSIGWEKQNVMFNTIDTLIGASAVADAFGGNQGADAKAWMSGSDVDATGALTISATASMEIVSDISNVSESTASAWVGATGAGFGAVVASNKVSSQAQAWYADGDVVATGGTNVTANDGTVIDALIELQVDSVTSNTSPWSNSDSYGVAGAVALNEVQGGALAYLDQATVAGGAVLVSAVEDASLTAHLESAVSSSGGSKFGTGASLAIGGLIVTNTVQNDAQAYVSGSTLGTTEVPISGGVTVSAANTALIDATLVNATESGNQAIAVTLAFNSIGWEKQNVLFNTLDALIGSPAIADAFGGNQGADAKAWVIDSAVDATGIVLVSALTDMTISSDIANESMSTASAWTDATGLSFGGVLASNKISSQAAAWIDMVEVDASGLTVSASETSTIGATIDLVASSETENTNPFSNSDAIGAGGAVALNDLRGGAKAHVVDAVVTGGAVTVTALEDASVTASLASEVSSSGGNVFGGGNSTAVSGLVATNVVNSGAQAWIESSTVGAVDDAIAGAVTVQADNTSSVSAQLVNSSTSAGNSVSVTLAFNTIGWESQNILFNTVDAILGDPLVSEAFEGETGAGAKAYLLDTTVDATGLLTVGATSDATITSDIRNDADSLSEALTGTSGMSFGAVIAMNKSSSQAEASIGWTSPAGGTITADGGIQVQASDTGAISATIDLATDSVSSNTNPASLSDSAGMAGAVALNDVRGGATAFIDRSTVASDGDVTVKALADASLTAHLESAVTSSGGSKFGSGTSIAASGLISTNTVQGGATASITNSSIGTPGVRLGGDVTVDAQNISSVDAQLVNATSSGNHAIGATLAFNTVGWAPQNILFNTIDAIIGDPLIANAFGANNGAGAQAYLQDTTLDATGLLSVSALADATISSAVANTSESTASAWTGATGFSFGAVIAQNKVSSAADASIDWSDAYAGARIITADGGVAVMATDSAAITAGIDLLSTSETSNFNPVSASDAIGIAGAVSLNDVRGGATAFIDGTALGVSAGDVLVQAIANAAINASLASEVTSAGGSQFGDGDSIAVGALIATNTVQGGAQAHVTNSSIDASGNVGVSATYGATLDAKSVNAATSQGISVSATLAFNTIGWASQNILFNAIDAILGDPLISEAFGGEDGAGAQAYLLDSTVDAGGVLAVSATAGAQITAEILNHATSDSEAISGTSGMSFGAVIALNKTSSQAKASIDFSDAYAGAKTISADTGISVTATDAAGIEAIIDLLSDSASRNTNPLSDSDSLGLSGAISLNDVRGGATAYIDRTTLVSDGAVTVRALADASLLAQLQSEAVSSGGNKFGSGTSLAFGGLIATNTVRGGAEAYITNSTVGTVGTATGGDVTVDAQNTAIVDAKLLNATSSGNQAIGVTLAFNTVGWAPQNILFNAVDTIIGSPEIGTAFGANEGAGAKAYLQDTTVDAAGLLAVSALSDASITSDVANKSESSASAWTGATGLSFGMVIALNKVSSDVQALIDWSAAYLGARTITADGGVAVSATDSAAITASIDLLSTSETVNTNAFSDSDAIGVAGAVSLNDVRGGATAFIDETTLNVSAGDVLVEALANASINASLESEVTSAGGSQFGSGDSIAVSGLIATNTVQGGAQAYVTNSGLTTTSAVAGQGDITVNAENTATLNAAVVNSSTSQGISVSATLAFNTIGWESQNILFNTIDAILGDPLVSEAFGADTGAGAKAYLLDTTVDATGQLLVSATSSAALTADISSLSTSESEAITGTTGLSFGAVIALNKTASAAEASIGWSDPAGGSISADDGVNVTASDTASIDAIIGLVSDSTTSNTNPLSDSDSWGIAGALALNDVRGGATASIDRSTVSTDGAVAVQALADASLMAQLNSSATSSGGSKFGSGASVAAGGLIATNTVRGGAEAFITNSTLGTQSNTIGGDVTVDAKNTSSVDAQLLNATSSGNQSIAVTLAFNTVGWAPQNILFNAVDTIIGDPLISDAFGADEGAGAKATLRDTTVDATGVLTVSALSDASILADVTNTSKSEASAWTGATGLGFGAVLAQNKVSSDADASISWSTGYTSPKTITADGGVVVLATDSAAITATIDLSVTSTTSNTNPFSESDSYGIAGAVALNDVRGGATASIDGTVVAASAGGVRVEAMADATLNAHLESAAISSGGSKFGEGASLAVSGLIATNTVQGGATASITNSTLGTSGARVGGNVMVDAKNTSSVDAQLVNATSSGNQSIAFTLAFNTIGWAPQNILFNTVDAILGDPLIANAFGANQGAGAKAYLQDSSVNATGGLTVNALSDASLNADVANTSESTATAWTDATGLSFGAVIAQNKVSSAAEASIDYSSAYAGARTITADGGVAVSATDSAAITSSIDLLSASETSNTNPFSDSDSYGLAFSISMNDVRGGAKATVDGATITASAGGVSVTALENATLDSVNSSVATSVGGSSLTGEGDSVAVSAVIATNVCFPAQPRRSSIVRSAVPPMASAAMSRSRRPTLRRSSLMSAPKPNPTARRSASRWPSTRWAGLRRTSCSTRSMP
jgi:hypothetical protein